MNPNQSQDEPVLFGAGGNWRVTDEVVDPKVVLQQGDLSCGVACGEMLLTDRGRNIAQRDIENLTGVPVSSQELANALNILDTLDYQPWRGGPVNLPGATDSELLDVLNTTGSWAAILWETGAGIGHMVIVDGIDDTGYVLIRDPWEGTRYKMIKDDFLKHWTQHGVYRRVI